MGDVWLARDVKLQVDVALKAVQSERLSDPLALERLRAEVRSARAVASPHVCRVYDLVEADGAEYVSMEYVDGATLRHVLATRSPLDLSEAREIALQLLAGLAAIHDAGLVHRDVKPDNVMLTRAGRVVLMDFGIAKAIASGGTVAGTPAYWAPEQAAGAPADPRADVFAAGIVLAEMVAPGGVRDAEARKALWLDLRSEPPELPDTPWSQPVRKAVAKDPTQRYSSAQALARALEDVAHRVTGIEGTQPYPGLSSFTEAQAEYFFGREAEVEGVWKRLTQRHLLAIVGPSGAGKSSFLCAGLLPAKSERWAHLICTPGTAPFIALGQALASEVSGDTDAVRQMVRFDDADIAVGLFRRWRSTYAEALVVVDQFEELFTLSPPEVQARFAILLSRLALEADVHVLLAMRDDFLLRCQEHEGLRPIFEGLVPLGALTGESLRRALVQPALKCGYRFEDESLVAGMLKAVEGERGALPLLAFAAASLWDRRDRDQGLLTHAGHDAIGGVAGALAQHAEATLDRVGADRLGLVRELFRNLVTAQGTRDVRDVAELLTVFPESQRADAESVLKTLIDARLLTSYEAGAAEPRERSGHRVEVVHESLLTAWPRLVRWRTEDEGGAQLRGQLRQAARLWEEKGKPEDLLWTGTSFQEYQVWRVRYPGGLSELEESFGRAMAVRAGRRRRMRRLAVAAGFVVLLGVVTVIGASLRNTRAALTRTEASRLVALGRAVGVDADPTSALAYAIASLERTDTAEARMLALDAMAHGPVAFIADRHGSVKDPSFSSDGAWLAVASEAPDPDVRLWSRDGRTTRIKAAMQFIGARAGFVPGADAVWTFDRHGERNLDTTLAAWSLPNGRKLAEAAARLPLCFEAPRDPARLAILQLLEGRAELRVVPVDPPGAQVLHTYTLPLLTGGWPRFTRIVAGKELASLAGPAIDPLGRWFAFPAGRDIMVQPFEEGAPARRLARHDAAVMAVVPSPDGKVVGARDVSGWIRLWSVATGKEVARLQCDDTDTTLEISGDGRSVLARGKRAQAESGPTAGSLLAWRLGSGSQQPGREIPLPDSFWSCATDPAMRWVGVATNTRHSEIWDLAAPSGARPAALRQGVEIAGGYLGIDPSGTWVATVSPSVSLWPLRRDNARVLTGFNKGINAVAFSHDGESLACLAKDSSSDMRVWPVSGDPPAPSRRLITSRDNMSFLIDAEEAPDGSFWAVSSYAGMALVPGTGGAPRKLEGFSTPGVFGVAISPDGSLVAGGGRWPQEAVIRLWDASSGREVAVLDTGDRAPILALAFLRDARLASGASTGVRIWDIEGRSFRTLWAPPVAVPDRAVQYLRSGGMGRLIFGYGRELVGNDEGHGYLADVATGTVQRLESHGGNVYAVAIDRTGTIVATGGGDGIVRVGPASGEEPHLLIGHTNRVTTVAISPAGDWIASGSDDTTVRLWPMPDLSKPPAHTLPLPELLAKLKRQTNLRVVADPAAPGGYRTEPGPFPGWAVVPEWQP
jgi:WD40 repeat protein